MDCWNEGKSGTSTNKRKCRKCTLLNSIKQRINPEDYVTIKSKIIMKYGVLRVESQYFYHWRQKNPDFKIGSQPKGYDTDYRPNCKWIVNDLSVRIN